MNKIAPILTVLFVILIFNFNVLVSINYTDKVSNSDEYVIKRLCSYLKYSTKELKQLTIEYLGVVDEYKIYFVSLKASYGSVPLVKQGFTFPPESQTRIVGIKNGKLQILGELLNENSINVKSIYELIQSKF